MESADALKNSNGEITIDSIEAYADKLFKNTPASEAVEQMKSDLTKALAQAESVVKEKVNEMAKEYKPQIENAVTNARQILSSVESMMSILPESVKTVINEASADLKDILAEVETVLKRETIEVCELRSFANRLDKKAGEYLNKIQADLTEAELAEIETRKTAVVNKMSEQKQALEKALDDAAKAAKDYLSELKEARKNASK